MLRVREAVGLTRAEMAAVFNVHKGTYWNWERGKGVPGGPARSILYELEAGRAPLSLRKVLVARELETTNRLLEVAKK